MERANLKSEFQLDNFRALAKKAKEVSEQRVTDDAEFACAPEEFKGKASQNIFDKIFDKNLVKL
jgi:hypothetical protein